MVHSGLFLEQKFVSEILSSVFSYTDGKVVAKLCFQHKFSLVMLSSSVLSTSVPMLLFEMFCLEFSSVLFTSL